jgi:hypothetical protein
MLYKSIKKLPLLFLFFQAAFLIPPATAAEQLVWLYIPGCT